jgi:hypothetical protein
MTRFRHTLSPEKQILLASGTTGNEALHAELNNWFRQTQQLHQSTLKLKLHILTLRKLIAHNSALFQPTSRQMCSNLVLASALAAEVWTSDDWHSWCGQLSEESRISKANVPLKGSRQEESRLVTEWMRKRPAAMVSADVARKKPASSSSGSIVRRTVFTLDRRDDLVRSGFKGTVYHRGVQASKVKKRPASGH